MLPPPPNIFLDYIDGTEEKEVARPLHEAAGRAVDRLTAFLAASAFVLLLLSMILPSVGYAAFPGTNGKIAFQSDRDGNYEIYVMNADGTGQTRLTNNPAADNASNWGPLPTADSDGDGIPDNKDDCPNSDLRPTVVIDGCNSGVPNTLFPTGCTIADFIAECAAGASNHGQFVSCVSNLTNDLKKAGTITSQQKSVVQSCAAKAHIP
jgi:hypothetical protein